MSKDISGGVSSESQPETETTACQHQFRFFVDSGLLAAGYVCSKCGMVSARYELDAISSHPASPPRPL